MRADRSDPVRKGRRGKDGGSAVFSLLAFRSQTIRGGEVYEYTKASGLRTALPSVGSTHRENLAGDGPLFCYWPSGLRTVGERCGGDGGGVPPGQVSGAEGLLAPKSLADAGLCPGLWGPARTHREGPPAGLDPERGPTGTLRNKSRSGPVPGHHLSVRLVQGGAAETAPQRAGALRCPRRTGRNLL